MSTSARSGGIFCKEPSVRRMLAVLSEPYEGKLAIADADDAEQYALSVAYTHRHSLPLLLFSRQPERVTSPPDIRTECLGRPFLFSEFCEAAEKLTETEQPAALPAVQEPRAGAPALLRWDPFSRTVFCLDSSVVLTEREADVFSALYEAYPGTVAREDLLRNFVRTSGNGAEVYITYLRRKLAGLPISVTVVSRRGRGYALLISDSTKYEN